MLQSILKNKKIQELLTMLEQGYEYPIAVLPAPAGFEHVNATACQDEAGRYVVYYQAAKNVTAYLIGHELMHLRLTLEGWPIPTLKDWGASSEEERLFCEFSRSSIEHFVLESRMHALGLFDDKEYYCWICGLMLFITEHDHPYRNIAEPLKGTLSAFLFAELELSPLSVHNKTNLLQSFSQMMPTATKYGLDLVRIYNNWEKRLPRDYYLFFAELFRAVNLQEMLAKYK